MSETDAVCVLDDDLDRLVEQRILVRVEARPRRRPPSRRRGLRRLEQALVELLARAGAALLDDHRDLLLGHVGALDALHARGAERLEEHVALAEQALGADASRITRESVWLETANAIRDGTFALIIPVMTSTDGRCVASTRWIPTARDFCASRMIASSTACGETIIRSASSSITTSRYGSGSSPRARNARFASGRLRAADDREPLVAPLHLGDDVLEHRRRPPSGSRRPA